MQIALVFLREEISDRFVTQAGYNEVAELNNIVILYPQAIATTVPLNPQGCWDWWGYTALWGNYTISYMLK